MKIRSITLLAGTCLASFAVVSPAFAQAAADSDAERDEIVVTGTNIRGVAPAGTEAITVSVQSIQEAGGITVQDVLAKVPQLSYFNTQPTAGNNAGVGQQQKVDQPKIHGLETLILLDGHRIAAAGPGAGGANTSIDPSIIPTGVLGGIEIVPEAVRPHTVRTRLAA